MEMSFCAMSRRLEVMEEVYIGDKTGLLKSKHLKAKDLPITDRRYKLGRVVYEDILLFHFVSGARWFGHCTGTPGSDFYYAL
jgi:hypothetical protein